MKYTDDYGTIYFKDELPPTVHREDGPAVIDRNGTEFYYLNNELYSKEKYHQLIKLRAFW